MIEWRDVISCFIGVVIAVVLWFGGFGIAAAVNNVSFGEQISNSFNTTVVEDTENKDEDKENTDTDTSTDTGSDTSTDTDSTTDEEGTA